VSAVSEVTSSVKSAFNIGFIVKVTLGVILGLVIFDYFNVTDWFLYPYSSIKEKFGKSAS